jgi:hypothetical protein
MLKYAFAAAGLALLAAGPAPTSAQTTLPPGPSSPMTPDRGPDQRRVPAHPRAEQPNDSLGQAPGVIQPPETGDTGVIVPRKQSNEPTPEIRPPGTPGGNPNVEPK